MRPELKIGIAVVLATVALVLGVRFLGGLPMLAGTDTYTLALDSGDGLAAGNVVALNGVQVGTVEDVTLDPRTHKVRARIRINDDLKLPVGTTVSRGGLAMFGGVRLNLQPGSSSAQVLPPGSEIPQSASGDALSALVERGPALASRLDTLALGLGLTVGEAYDLLGNENSDLRTALASLRRSSTGLDQTIRAVGPRADLTVAEAQRAALEYRLLASQLRADAGPAVADLRRIATRAETTLDGVDGVVADVRYVTASRRDSLALAIDRANRTLVRLDTTIAEGHSALIRADSLLAIVEAGRGNVGMLLNDSTLYLRLDTTAAKADDLIDDFRRNPGRYLRRLKLFSLF
ncbi:MAG: MlaD family protein [Bacteroidetes bacterium]|nr:MlaD family protein [Bacteroidota bacterium]